MERTSGSGGGPVRPLKMQHPTHLFDQDAIDLTGVDPLRLTEIRRRVGVIKSYVAIARPDEGDRQRHAHALGLSINQFLALVRAWREHGRAKAISGAGASRGIPRKTGPRNLPKESKDAAREVVGKLGAEVSHVEAVAAVQARCAELGVRPPSRSTIWNIVMASRRDARGGEGVDELIVSQCHAKLPVEQDGAVTFPSLLLVVNSADGSVLGAALGCDGAALGTIVGVLHADNQRRELLVDADLARELDTDVSDSIRTIRPSAARTATAKALGRGFGSIELIYQIGRAVRPEQTLRSRKDRPLQPPDAHELIFDQLSAHNAVRGVEPPLVSWLNSRLGSSAAA